MSSETLTVVSDFGEKQTVPFELDLDSIGSPLKH